MASMVTETKPSGMFVALAKKVEVVADKTETDLKVLAKEKKAYSNKKKEGSAPAVEEDEAREEKSGSCFKSTFNSRSRSWQSRAFGTVYMAIDSILSA